MQQRGLNMLISSAVLILLGVGVFVLECFLRGGSDFSFFGMHQQQEAKNSNYQQRLDIVSKPDVWRPRFGDEERILTNDQLKQQFTLPMLMFHYIKDIPATSPDQLGYKLSYSPQKLEELLQFLKAHDIKTLTFWDLKAIAEGRKPQPSKSVILTFDDGHREHFNLVMPLLKKYGATAVFFVITDFADKDPLFVTREEIGQMMEAGFEIGSHTLTHPNLSGLSRAAALDEVLRSKQALEEQLGIPIISFCYPAGRYNDWVLQQVKKHYLFARTTRAGHQFSLTKRWQLPTVRIHPTTKPEDLAKYWNIVGD